MTAVLGAIVIALAAVVTVLGIATGDPIIIPFTFAMDVIAILIASTCRD